MKNCKKFNLLIFKNLSNFIFKRTKNYILIVSLLLIQSSFIFANPVDSLDDWISPIDTFIGDAVGFEINVYTCPSEPGTQYLLTLEYHSAGIGGTGRVITEVFVLTTDDDGNTRLRDERTIYTPDTVNVTLFNADGELLDEQQYPIPRGQGFMDILFDIGCEDENQEL